MAITSGNGGDFAGGGASGGWDETPSRPASVSTGPKKEGIYAEIGKRPKNPLGWFSSYTYQFTIYMITPDALVEFNTNGRKTIPIANASGEYATSINNPGAYIIAQSGGVNNDATRAPGFKFDYYIDNVTMTSAVDGKSNNGATIAYEMNLTIIEPYGFSFVSNLKRAMDALARYSKTKNYSDAKNASRQFFIIGLKFLGYDKDGNVMTTLPDGTDATFQRYFDVQFTNIKFKVDGRATTYNITAAPVAIQAGLGQKQGSIDKGANQLTGTTVKNILDKLKEKLNKDQKADFDNGNRDSIAKYDFVFIDDAEEIANSTIISSADWSKEKWPMATPADKKQVNAALEIKATPNNTERIVSFNRDTPILQAVTSIITQSDYITKSLIKTYTTEEEPNQKEKDYGSVKTDSNKVLKWFNIVPAVSNIRFDKKRQDWISDITYQIRTYDVPVVLSPAVNKTPPYYGPVKRYEYWYTGLNSEILKYEQNFDNTFFSTALSTMNMPSSGTGGDAAVPVQTQKSTYGDNTGKLNLGKQAQNSVTNYLLSPGDYANAKIEILGDPDYLSNPTPMGNETTKAFYMPDGSIDFRAGQIFIEIKFLEAVDYDNEQGTMIINNNILFWDYPVSIAEQLQGAVSYRIVTVKHSFKGGKFTQELDCSINTFGNVTGPKLTDRMKEESANAMNADAIRKATELENSQLIGLKQDSEPSQGTNAGTEQVSTPNNPNLQSTTTGGVQNDDTSYI